MSPWIFMSHGCKRHFFIYRPLLWWGVDKNLLLTAFIYVENIESLSKQLINVKSNLEKGSKIDATYTNG